MATYPNDQDESTGIVADDLPGDVQNIIARHNPELADILERVKPIRLARFISPRAPEELTADDYTWLWDFEYNGEKLSAKDIAFIIAFAKNGFERIRDSLREAGVDPTKEPWLKPVVNAALYRATQNSVNQWQCNASHITKTLKNILTARLTDVVDITPQGIGVKNIADIPHDALDAIQEIHETRNAQGTQLRIRMHDKIAAATTLARVMGLMQQTTVNVEVNVLEDRLASALQRLGRDPETIDGEFLAQSRDKHTPTSSCALLQGPGQG